MNRREALIRMGGFAAMGLFGSRVFAETSANSLASTATASLNLADGKPFTIAHLTDIHITDKLHAEKWVSDCFHEIQSHAAKPSFIINTGDCVLDSTRTERDQADHLWKVWNRTLQRDNSLPMYHCLGNHDIWGLKLEDSDPAKKDALYGKKLALDKLGLEHLYYSFDQGGWHIVMLDSIMPGPNGQWMGMLDDEQFHWLENDLKKTPADRPVMICSHMPIIEMCAMTSMDPNKDHSYEISSTIMMGDANRLIDLFRKHKNVKLCFSGHMHRLDRIELAGVTYICDGAMCGSKWKKLGTYTAEPGYSITTLRPDGTFDYKYETFGWKLDA